MCVTFKHGVTVAVLWGMLGVCRSLSWSAQPPGRVSFSNSTGGVVRCVASPDHDRNAEHSAVTVTWLGDDGAPLADLPGIREVSVNGSLVFRPFAASVWSAAVHATRYRCRAMQVGKGAILSRPVYVNAVLDTWWEVTVVQPMAAPPRGAGLLLCSVSPPSLRPHLVATGWTKDDRPLSRAELRDGEVGTSSDGLMLVVWSANPHPSAYGCSVANQLTGHTRRSQPHTIQITESSVQSAPMIVRASPVTASAAAGSEARLLCVATGNPPPHYSWFRESLGRLVPVPSSSGVLSSGVLSVTATRALAGGWACRAHNALGEARAHLTLTVLDPLRVTIQPKLHVADSGSMVAFNCSASGGTAAAAGDAAPLSVRWLRDGTPAAEGTATASQLTVRAARHTAGLYQCEVTSGDLVDSDAAELRIGESAPELVYTFIEQAVRPGASLSLRCRAVGAPQPAVGWLIDGEPIDRVDAPHRSVSQWSTSQMEIEWQLNVSVSRAADGGRYTCRAVNSRGSAEHSARLNVYGPPAVRSVGPIRAVAGHDVTVHCPYSGFPISEIRWQREGVDIGGMNDAGSAGDGRRVTVMGDGVLRLRAADASDAGRYVCRVTDPQGHYAQNDLQIFVRIPPKISGFTFPTDLVEGSSVQVLCGITTGDRPIYFSWLKDGKHIPSNLQIKEKSQDEFSFLIFSHLTSAHSGDYTCVATNSAAEVNHTATLTVKVAPSWEQEPTDVAALLGSQVVLPCATRGHPLPRIQWSKDQAGGGGGDEWRGVTELDLQYALHPNGSLVIAAAATHHEGRYRCSADNGVGRGLSKTITLTVNEPAHFEFSSRNVTVKRASAARLTCDARGDPPLTVSWTHDNKPLDLNTYRLSISEKRSSAGVTSTLSIAHAERGDSGAYRCRADNAYGADEMLLYLAVQEYPEAPAGLRVMSAGPRSARVWWRRGYDGNARVSAYRLQQRAVGTNSPGVHDWLHAPTLLLHTDTLTDRAEPATGSPGVEYEMTGLRPATAYALRVAAVNDIGDSDYSQPVIVNTKEEAPSEPPHSVEVLANVPGELLVTWQAPPQDSWHGSLLGYVVWWRASGHPTQNAVQTLTVRGWGSSRAVLAPLLSNTAYAVRVRAFNAEGPGPPAPVVNVNTLDGVPSSGPVSVHCAALSSQSLRVWWEPPPDVSQGSRLTEYVVIYEAAESSASATLWRRVSVNKPDAVLGGLRAGTNYTVLVQARTAAGLGPANAPVYCVVQDDVPGSPSSVSAAAASESALAVRWLAPDMPNGRLKHYTVYYRLQRSGSPLSLVVPYTPGAVEQGTVLRGLSAAPHELWVTASNVKGEGDTSAVLIKAPMHRAPAKVLSFSRRVAHALGTRVTLPCAAAGSPPPLRQWSRRRVATSLTDDPRLQLDGEQLVILSVDSDVADNYTCTARNPWGEDRVELAVRALVPPPAPALRVRDVSVASGTLAWDSVPTTTPDRQGVTVATVTGYTLEYALEGSSSWSAVYLPGSVRDYSLTTLTCGALYRARITAHSAIGASANSREVTVDTKSGKSSPPNSEELLSANSTCVRVNLLLWDSGGCGVRGWEVAWRVPSGPWQMLTVPPDEGPLIICELQPASWYQLGVRPLTDLNPPLHHMYVSTLTTDGARIPAMSALPGGTGSGGGAGRLAAAGAALGAVLAALMLGAAIWRKRCSTCISADKAEAPPSTTATSGKSSSSRPRDCQQLYSCSPTTKLTKDQDLYEISPYATFSMSDAAPPNTLRAPPPPGSNKHRSPLNPEEYTLSRAMTLAVRRVESDSESSGSPCCECSHQTPNQEEVFPAAAGPDRVTDSSCESTDARSLSSRGGRAGGAGSGPSDRRRRNRRHHTPNYRYPPPPGPAPRQQQERRDFTIHV